MLSQVRDALYRVLVTPAGDTLTSVRIPKDLARRLNSALGRPLAPRDELERREKARLRLEELRRAPVAPSAPSATSAPEPAPVLVYFEAGRNSRELGRIEELLAAKNIGFRRMDVTGDEATVDFVVRAAGCERDELPVVFVADRVVGPFDALVRADVSGELARLVRGG